LRDDILRRATILILVGLCYLFYNAEVIFADLSGIFQLAAPLPPVAESGREVLFKVKITNTGTEN